MFQADILVFMRITRTLIRFKISAGLLFGTLSGILKTLADDSAADTATE